MVLENQRKYSPKAYEYRLSDVLFDLWLEDIVAKEMLNILASGVESSCYLAQLFKLVFPSSIGS